MGHSSILAAAHLKVYVNGRLLGWATGADWRVRAPTRPAQGIDTSLTFERIPTVYEVGGSITVYRGRYQGGAEGLGIMAFGKDLLRQKYATLEVVDRVTDMVMYKAVGVTFEDQGWSIQKGLVQGTFQFCGLDFSNEADQ